MSRKDSDNNFGSFDRGHAGNLKGDAMPPVAKGGEDSDGVDPRTGGSAPMPKAFEHDCK